MYIFSLVWLYLPIVTFYVEVFSTPVSLAFSTYDSIEFEHQSNEFLSPQVFLIMTNIVLYHYSTWMCATAMDYPPLTEIVWVWARKLHIDFLVSTRVLKLFFSIFNNWWNHTVRRGCGCILTLLFIDWFHGNLSGSKYSSCSSYTTN